MLSASSRRARTPAIERERSRMRRARGIGCCAGMGDVSFQSNVQAAYQVLPPDLQGPAAQLYAQGESAVATADQVGAFVSGLVDAKSSAEQVALVAGVVSSFNPVAGAALGAAAAGEAALEAGLTALFDGLGLYDHPRHQGAVGLIPTDSQGFILWPAPSPNVPLRGPSDSRWMHFDGLHNADRRCSDYYNQTGATLTTCTYGPGGPGTIPYTVLLDHAIAILEPYTHPESGMVSPPLPATEIERQFAKLLRANLEMWANAFPFVPPRQLLTMFQTAWNAHHAATTTQHFPYPKDASAPQIGAGLVQQILATQFDPYATGIDFNTGPTKQKIVAVRSAGPAPAMDPKTQAFFVVISVMQKTGATSDQVKASGIPRATWSTLASPVQAALEQAGYHPASSSAGELAAVGLTAAAGTLAWWLGSHGWKWVTPRWARKLVR